MSSDEEIVSTRKKKFVVDSGSSDENNRSDVQVNNSRILSNDEDGSDENSSVKTKRKKKKKSRKFKAFSNSSDSEIDELPISQKSLVSNTERKEVTDDQGGDSEKTCLKASSSEDDLTKKSEPIAKKSWYKNNDVFGSESSDDEELRLNKEFENIDEKKSESDKQSNSDRNSENSDNEESKDKIYKKRGSSPQFHRKERKSKTKAKNEIQDIHKETQRMMRESQVSIPYHRPRQLTLAKFLDRRKAIPVVSLHTTPEELSTAWKAIEQREKEAELFYKSESSEEEDENKSEVTNRKNEHDKFYQPEYSDASEKENSINDPCKTTPSKLLEQVARRLNIEEQQGVGAPEFENKINASEKLIESNLLDKNNIVTTGIEFEKDVHMTNLEIQKTIEDKMVSEKECLNNLIGESDTNSVIDHQSIIKSFDNQNSGEPNTDSFDDNTEMTGLSLSGCVNQEQKEVEKQEINRIIKSVDNQCSGEPNTESFDDNTEMTDLSLSDQINQDQTKVEKQVKKGKACDDIAVNILATGYTEEYSLRFSETLTEYESFSKTVESHNMHSIKQTENKDSLTNSNIEFHKVIEDKLNDILKGQEDVEVMESQREFETGPKNNFLKNLENEDCKELTNEIVLQSGDKEVVTTEVELERNEEMRLNDKYNFKPSKPILNAPKIVDPETGMIHFEEVLVKPGVNGLMERFYTHLSYKKKPKKKTPVELNIVSAETDAGGQVSAILEETVQVLVGEDEEEQDPTLSKPGVRRAKLQATLRAEMGRQREVEWTKRQQEQRLYEEEIYEGEKDICDEDEEADKSEDDNDMGGDESNKESGEEEEEEEESEEDEEMEDSEFKENKNKQKNKFVDDEAEESGDGDGEEEDDEDDSFIRRPKQQKAILKRTATADMFFSQEALKLSNAEDEELPSFQKPLTLQEKPEEVESSETSSVCPSPAFQLTALEGKDISNIYNWSGPATPCKDYVNSRTTTPVRVRGQLVDRSPLVASQDLEILCSGEFSSQPLEEVEENATQDFHLFLEDSQTSPTDTPIATPLKSDKKSFDEKDTMRKLLLEDDDEISASIVSKKVKKLNFSDDEDDDDFKQAGEDSDHESSEKKEEQEDGSDGEEEVQPADDVDYDSEENEVVKTAGDFLDKEAELSEEEWESEDEDEQGLDLLEMEEADREQINERKLQRELGQMHIKQMLMEDKKEVRILQEMLLEDGELHSESKRQRLFRWSNNSFAEDEKRALIGSDDENADDDEDEENWRKSRHEREQYLQEHRKKAEKLELAAEEHSDSQLLMLGQKALKRMNSSNSQEPKVAATVDPLASPNPKQPYKILMSRGSFLSRGNQVLSRLAQMTTGSDGPIKQPKNNRNFLFTTVSPTKDQEESKPTVQPNNKRKRVELPLPMAKRPCAPKSKTANKKSLFEALFKAKS